MGKQLLGAKVRFKDPIKYFGANPKDSYLYSGVIKNRAYPYGFMTGEWFEIDRVSGDYFNFKGANTSSMPYTLNEFSGDDWEWEFK